MNNPHTITIYNRYNDKYLKSILNEVYWYGSESINVSGKGIVDSGSISIIIEKENLNKYVSENDYQGEKQKFTLQNGMRIVLGIGPDINSLNDIPDNLKQMTVTSYEENIVGSSLDHILVTGR